MFRADLHCHSTHSDGQKSPKDLVLLAKKIGLSGLSITDHDAISAYEEVHDFAQKQKVELLSGLELSCGYSLGRHAHSSSESVHVLGYGFDSKDLGLKALCKEVCLARKARNYAIADRLAKKQMPIDIDRLYQENTAGSIGRPHLAKELLEKGHVHSFKEAFIQFLGDGKSCFVPLERISVEKGIEAIHRAHGFAVLAHPHLLKSALLKDELLKLDFDGIEARYAKMPSNRNARFEALARKRGWIVSAGSDFHGEEISFASLGDSFVDKEVFDQLKQGRA